LLTRFATLTVNVAMEAAKLVNILCAVLNTTLKVLITAGKTRLVCLVVVAAMVAVEAASNRPRRIAAPIAAVAAATAFSGILTKAAAIATIAAAARTLPRKSAAPNALILALNGFCPCFAIVPAKFISVCSKRLLDLLRDRSG
jgi:hypothetical protein